MATKYKKTSPYSQTPMVNNYLGIWNSRAISKKQSDVYYEIDAFYDRRPDIMAYDLYGDPSLWWVFAVRNPSVIKDPIFDFTAGKRIFVPAKATLFNDLGL
jgi:hypothetical protein